MIIVLLTLLAIALTLVVAGLFLSPRAGGARQNPVVSSYASREAARARMTRRGTSSQAHRNDTTSIRQLQQPVRAQRVARLQSPRAQTNYGIYDIVEPVSPVAAGWTQIFALLNVKQLIQPRRGEVTPWLGICLILIALFGAGMVALQPLLFAPSSTIPSIWTVITSDMPASAPKPASKPASNPSQPLFVGEVGASKALVRLNQMSVDQYQSQGEFNQWAASACSAASMTEVINAYSGHHFRVTDILKVEANLHQITPELGLLQPSGIDATVDRFGFQATHLNNPSLDEVIKIANQGRPVIVSFPPSAIVPGGHILVIRGGNSDQVYLADSSILNQTSMSRSNFLSLWRGFAVVVTPKK